MSITDNGDLPKLTPKQAVWLAAYTNHGNKETFQNASASARAAYSCKKETAAAIGSQNYSKLNAHIVRWLDEQDFSVAKIKQNIVAASKASGITFQKITFTGDEKIKEESLPPGVKIITQTKREALLAFPTADWFARHQSNKLAAQIRGMIPKGGQSFELSGSSDEGVTFTVSTVKPKEPKTGDKKK